MRKTHSTRSYMSRFTPRGFSLVELIVVISIFTMISLVVVTRHAAFNNSTLLNNLAYDIALSIRESQALGTSVQGVGSSFNVAYGVLFDVATPTQFTLYASDFLTSSTFGDNDLFDVDAVVSTSQLTRGHRIDRFCVESAVTVCSGPGPGDLGQLYIATRRPNPDALIRGVRNGGNVVCSSTCRRAYIVVASSEDQERIIEVRPTGQISVE